MVTAAEAAEVQQIVSQAGSGGNYDFSRLSADSAARLDALYTSINGKVGFVMPDIPSEAIRETTDSAANAYIGEVNTQLAAASASLRNARLTAFAQAFE